MKPTTRIICRVNQIIVATRRILIQIKIENESNQIRFVYTSGEIKSIFSKSLFACSKNQLRSTKKMKYDYLTGNIRLVVSHYCQSIMWIVKWAVNYTRWFVIFHYWYQRGWVGDSFVDLSRFFLNFIWFLFFPRTVIPCLHYIKK